MIFYHRTYRPRARAILRNGWRDGSGHYGMPLWLTGVWLSAVPLDRDEGAIGDTVLRLVLPLNRRQLDRYEVVEEGRPHREWLIPARVLNERGRRLVVVSWERHRVVCDKLSPTP
jgi:hypothetical protein